MRYENNLQVMKDYVLKTLSYHLNYPLVRPERVNIATTLACPLNCEMCGLVDTYDPEKDEISVKDWKKIIKQIKDWGIEHISFSGGETLARKRKTLDLIEYCKNLGLDIDLITNGYHMDEETSREVIETGVDRITLSVEGSKEEIHDSVRGEGSFKRIVRAVDNLNKFRSLNSNIELEFSTVVLNKNYRDLINIYELMKKSNFDFINYQALLPDNSFDIGQDYNDELWLDQESAEELKIISEELIKIKEETGDIRNTKKYLRKMPEYFKKKQSFDYGKCMAGYEVIHIDPYGNIDLCGFSPEINVKDKTLKRVWKSRKYEKIRRKVKKCDRPCLLLCYRKLDLGELLKTHLEASIGDEE